jgi:hypothetical protein
MNDLPGGIPSVSITAWRQAVATRANADVATVERVLRAYSVEAAPVLPRPRTLCIRSISFLGQKSGTQSKGAIAFEWNDLGSGVWALLSDRNLRGKSSVLAIMRAAVQGRFPGEIKPDVWLWLSTVNVEFQIDQTRYRVSVLKNSGEKSIEKSIVRLSRFQGDLSVDLYSGSLGDDFEQHVSSLFATELGIQPFFAYNSRIGAAHPHEWAAIASALFLIHPDQKMIFGDNVVDALPLRLLQMFMGLPWVSTHTAAQANAKAIEAKLEQARSDGRRSLNQRKVRLDQLKEREGQIEDGLQHLPDRVELRRMMAEKDAELLSVQEEVLAALPVSEAAANASREAERATLERRRELLQLEHDVAAGYVFRKLRPVCCPACEADIDGARFKSRPQSTCTLCGTEAPPPEDSGEEEISEIRRDIKEAERTVEDLRRQAKRARDNYHSAIERRTRVSEEIRSIAQALSGDEGGILEKELIGIKARIEELELVPEPEREKIEYEVDLRVLAAAAVESKEVFDELQRSVLVKVAAKMLEYSSAFGVQNLESMEFDQGGKLKIKQGSAQTFFGSLAPGERLRVRIAAALAVVGVSRETGYGRHPGLLVLDAPGAQEVVQYDLEKMLAAVSDTVASTDGFQIIIGAVARPEFLDVVPAECRKQVTGDSYLF